MLLLLLFSIIYPLFFVLFTSFKDYAQFVKNPFSISFSHPENYVTAWTVGNFSKYFTNSVIVVCSIMIVQLFLTSIISFAIGRLKFKGCGIIYFFALSTMFFSGEITSIPLFLLIRDLNLYDSYWALIVPGMLALSGTGVMLGSNFLRKIPHEIIEASIIDGAGILRVFFSIDLHFLRSIIILQAVLSFNAIWSDYMWPLIVIPTNQNHWTLPLGLVKFYSVNNANFGVLSAGLCIITLPVILFYTFFSKYFIEGVSMGAVKG
jgi:ABC-type glycerol-3-phosphate transport system permease component